MKIYNSMSKTIEEFKPQNLGFATMYTCGPTVYGYVHVGNYRTYMLGDFINRVLMSEGYKVHYIMNITDVGHLESDADTGGDKIEEAAKKEGKTVEEITSFYISDFYKSIDKLNIYRPKKFTKASEYIDEQIDLVATLEEKGYTYETSDGLYFDTSKFEDYGKLSGLTVDNIKEGARVDPNPEKKNPTDFALWKFSPKDSKRLQEWNSPWGVGFPGWHAECSAMAMKELGNTVDIHVGGEDLRMIHHQNEIAQSECATGEEYVRYWVHGIFLTIDGGKMSRSRSNFYNMTDVEEHGFDPLALRYFYMTAHYRSPLNFTWEALQAAQNSLKKLYDIVSGYKSNDKAQPSDKYLNQFNDKVQNDLNFPEALAVMWEMLKSPLTEATKLATILEMDGVLGLKIDEKIGYELPDKVVNLAKMRSEYRKTGIWDKADVLRKEIKEMGYIVEDLPEGKFKLKKR